MTDNANEAFEQINRNQLNLLEGLRERLSKVSPNKDNAASQVEAMLEQATTIIGNLGIVERVLLNLSTINGHQELNASTFEDITIEANGKGIDLQTWINALQEDIDNEQSVSPDSTLKLQSIIGKALELMEGVRVDNQSTLSEIAENLSLEQVAAGEVKEEVAKMSRFIQINSHAIETIVELVKQLIERNVEIPFIEATSPITTSMEEVANSTEEAKQKTIEILTGNKLGVVEHQDIHSDEAIENEINLLMARVKKAPPTSIRIKSYIRNIFMANGKQYNRVVVDTISYKDMMSKIELIEGTDVVRVGHEKNLTREGWRKILGIRNEQNERLYFANAEILNSSVSEE